MDLRYLTLTVTLLFAERIWSLPLACPYNGTTYGDGEAVRTEEPCLICVCQGGALECSLRVCADQPTVLPQGCFFLHKPGECCPQLFCEEETFTVSDLGVELRTDLKLENKLSGNDCTINGSLYAEGSAVASSQVCEYCYCIEGETKCIKPRCLQAFQGCKAIYEKSSCCPTHYDCRDADVDLLRTEIENFVVATAESKTSNDSSGTVATLEEKSSSDEGEDSSEKPRETTTAEDAAPTEVTTAPSEEDNLTSPGFQTTKAEQSNKDTTAVAFPEETTPAPEVTTEVPSTPKEDAPVDFSEDNRSQDADDYDTYDYGEPRLPPSLPNLVIFPFVAADAVVKEDPGAPLGANDKMEIKRIDAHPVFYKDYFSPPAKTEGGFVPKEPFYFREDQLESPGEDPKGDSLCGDTSCSLPESAFAVDKQWTRVTSVGTVDGDLKYSLPLGQKMRPEANDFLFNEESPTFPKSQHTKKPVTVTYKNVVVDFYPNYLITTTRARPKVPSQGTPSAEVQVTDGRFHPNAAETPSTFAEEITSSTPPKITRETSSAVAAEETSTGGTTSESSFFDEFLKSLLSEEMIPTTTVTTTTTTTTTTARPKHKYSSKFKGHANAVRDEADQKAKPDSVLEVLLRTEDPAVTGATRKQVKKDANGSSTETPRSPEKPETGALLKLAGCNIYGMMYRVGKLITELSGPCLECLCTDLGVQCRSLGC